MERKIGKTAIMLTVVALLATAPVWAGGSKKAGGQTQSPKTVSYWPADYTTPNDAETGVGQLKALGLSIVIDMRSSREASALPDTDIGAENIHINMPYSAFASIV